MKTSPCGGRLEVFTAMSIAVFLLPFVSITSIAGPAKYSPRLKTILEEDENPSASSQSTDRVDENPSAGLKRSQSTDRVDENPSAGFKRRPQSHPTTSEGSAARSVRQRQQSLSVDEKPPAAAARLKGGPSTERLEIPSVWMERFQSRLPPVDCVFNPTHLVTRNGVWSVRYRGNRETLFKYFNGLPSPRFRELYGNKDGGYCLKSSKRLTTVFGTHIPMNAVMCRAAFDKDNESKSQNNIFLVVTKNWKCFVVFADNIKIRKKNRPSWRNRQEWWQRPLQQKSH